MDSDPLSPTILKQLGKKKLKPYGSLTTVHPEWMEAIKNRGRDKRTEADNVFNAFIH